MITAIEEHSFFKAWQPAAPSHAHDKLVELVKAYTTLAAMRDKTGRYSHEMGLIRGRLQITVDTDPAQLATDKALYDALGQCWDACYREEQKSESDAKRLELDLANLDGELKARRNAIDRIADKIAASDATPDHLRSAKAQWAYALQSILRRQPEDFA